MNKANEYGVKEAVKYMQKLIRYHTRIGWILGIITNIYLFTMAYCFTNYRIKYIISNEILLIIIWLVISVVIGVFSGAIMYQICTKHPRIFYKENIASDELDSCNPLTNIKALLKLFKSYFSLYRITEFIVYLAIGSIVVLFLYNLNQLRFIFLVLTGWMLGIDLYWQRQLGRKKYEV